jgi:hypothetical protein
MTKTETIKYIKEEILPKEREEGQTEQCKDVLAMNYLIGKNKGANLMLHEVHSTLPSVYDYIEERVREEMREEMRQIVSQYSGISAKATEDLLKQL